MAAKGIYKGIVNTEKSLGHILLLLIRLYWGGMLVITGYGKLANIDGVASFFASINIPFPIFTAYLVGIFELLGGLSLFFGFFARLMTIPLVVIFIVAYITAHSEALVTFFVNPSLFISQQPFLYLYASLIVMCFGSGAISIDYWWERKALSNR